MTRRHDGRRRSISKTSPGLGVRPVPDGSDSTVIAFAALRSLVLMVIAMLLVLVVLPAALVAARM